jgi:hypothetical protein
LLLLTKQNCGRSHVCNFLLKICYSHVLPLHLLSKQSCGRSHVCNFLLKICYSHVLWACN